MHAQAYKESARDDLDLVTGVQLVDGETRLFILEGLAANETNAMGKIGKLLERRNPNSSTAFTLLDTSISFPSRLYNMFEMPTKLIKLRATLPALLLRPDVYQYLRVAEGCRDALLCLGCLLGSSTMRLAFKANSFPQLEHLLLLEKKFGGVQLVADREGVMADDDDDEVFDDFDASAPAGSSGHRARQRQRHERRKAPTDCLNDAWWKSLRQREHAPKVDYLRKNIAELPAPPPPKPLPDWYLDAIPKVTGPVYMYSGQRLNQTDVQKEMLRAALAKLHTEQNKHMTYSKEFLWADSVGDREPRKPTREMIASLKPDAHLAPWDTKKPIPYNRDGTRAHFGMLQPSDYRSQELEAPWDEEALLASRKPLSRGEPPAGMLTKKLWTPYPCPNSILDENPKARFTSIFGGQTEEEMAAEVAERIDGAISTWKDKLVVDDPVLRVDLRSRDHVPQADRLNNILQDAPTKRSYRSLYRGKFPMGKTVGEPSAFMREPVPLASARERLQAGEENELQKLALTWRGSQVWKSPQPRS